jgi:hypothetical protein
LSSKERLECNDTLLAIKGRVSKQMASWPPMEWSLELAKLYFEIIPKEGKVH